MKVWKRSTTLIDTLKSRPDVTVVLNSFYKGTCYTLTIPAGADLGVLVDSKGLLYDEDSKLWWNGMSKGAVFVL